MKSVLTAVDYQVINNLIAQRQQVGLSRFTRAIQSLGNEFMCEWNGHTFYIYKNGRREDGIQFVVGDGKNELKNVEIEQMIELDKQVKINTNSIAAVRDELEDHNHDELYYRKEKVDEAVGQVDDIDERVKGIESDFMPRSAIIEIIQELQRHMNNQSSVIDTVQTNIQNHTHLGFGNDGLWHFKMFEYDEPGLEGDVGWNRDLVLQYNNWEGILPIMKFNVHSSGHACTTRFHTNMVVDGNVSCPKCTVSDQLYFSNSTVGNDYARIRFSGQSNVGELEIAVADDLSEEIVIRQYKWTDGATDPYWGTVGRTLKLLDSSGNTTFPGIIMTNRRLRLTDGNDKNYVEVYNTEGGNLVAVLYAPDRTELKKTTLMDVSGNMVVPGMLTVNGSVCAGTVRTPNGGSSLRFATSANAAFMTFQESDNTLHLYRDINMNGHQFVGPFWTGRINNRLWVNGDTLRYWSDTLASGGHMYFQIGKGHDNTGEAFWMQFTNPGKATFRFYPGNVMMKMDNATKTITVEGDLVVKGTLSGSMSKEDLKDQLVEVVGQSNNAITVTYTTSDTLYAGATVIYFTPAITVNNFPVGEGNFVQISLSNNSAYGINYKKVLENGRYKLTFTGGELTDSYFIYRHNVSNVTTKQVRVYPTFVDGVPVYNVCDDDIENGIANSLCKIGIPSNLTVRGTVKCPACNLSDQIIFDRGIKDYARIRFSGADEKGELEIAIGDDVTEEIVCRQYRWTSDAGSWGTVARTLKLLDANGNTEIPGKMTVNGELSIPNGIYVTGDTQKGRLVFRDDAWVIELMGINDTNWDAAARVTLLNKKYEFCIHGLQGLRIGSCILSYDPLGGKLYISNSTFTKSDVLWSSSQTITHHTNATGEVGTFCEATGKIYDGYNKIAQTDCICQVQQATSLNKKIVGIVSDENEFASHGDVLVKVDNIEGLEIGDILCPDENGYGRKATDEELMFMMLHAIPRPKITSFETGIEGFVACFIV